MPNWVLPSWLLRVLQDHDDDLMQVVVDRRPRRDPEVFLADPADLAGTGLLHRRDGQVQDAGDERPGVVGGEWDWRRAGCLDRRRDQNGVLDVRPHGARGDEGGDGGAGGVDGEGERPLNVVCAGDGGYRADQAAGWDSGCLRRGRQQERALILGRDIDLLIEGHDDGPLEDDAGAVDVRQH
jgi:hypothetical protein